jgi:hypothetical protein
MRTSTSILVTILALSAAVLAANTASAGWSFGGGGNGGGHSGFKISFGGGHHNQHGDHHDTHHHHHKYWHYPKYYKPVVVVYDQCYHPYYSYCFVYPGDTWYTIAKRCYGHIHLWKHIAAYNHLRPANSVLIPGQQIQLPVINADGTLAASNAPAPVPFAAQGLPAGPQGAPLGQPIQGLAPQGLANGQPSGSPLLQNGSSLPVNSSIGDAPAANLRTIPAEPKRPVVTLGSTLALDGQSLGTAKGIVRLRISGMNLPVDVLGWSDSAVKIKLPTLDLSEAMNADLEVVRADGSLASKSPVELMPAATRLALEN